MTRRDRRESPDRPLRLALPALLVLAMLAGCRSALRAERDASWHAAVPPGRPAGSVNVPAGADLQQWLDGAAPHATLALSPGAYRGPLVVKRPVTLWGPREAVVRTSGEGTTIAVASDSVALLGFTVDGSGTRYDRLDAGVHVRGRDIRVEGLTVRRALFGIVAEESRRVTVAGNDIAGDPAQPPGLRGDAIRFWETRDSDITGNHVAHSRDIVVWYSPGNRIARNLVEDGRYGTHFMYSSESVVENNQYLRNVVGVFVMYSRDIRLLDNVLAGATTADGMGIGCKESGNLLMRGNRFVRDRVGLYLDTSPLVAGDSNACVGNRFALCQSAIVFHSSEDRNRFADNRLDDNLVQVEVEGRGTAMGVTWIGNYFDDYRGYDFDGDGVGDVPYESRSLSEQLASGRPELQFFRGAIVLGLLDVASQVLPILEPVTLLRDTRPRMRPDATDPRTSEVSDAR